MQKKLIIIAIAILGIVISCTKLDTKPFSVMLKEDYHPTIGQIGAAYVAPVYVTLRPVTGSNQAGSAGDVYQDQSFCTDEALTPRRIPGDWYDGGHFWHLFEHTWDATLTDLPTLWTFGYGVVSIANQNIYNIQLKFPGQESVTTSAIEEIKVVRSLGYYYLIDFFGNVPITTKYDPDRGEIGNNPDFQTGRNMLFDTIVNDIKTAMPYLSAKKSNDPTCWGTINKWTAFALLAKMYINSEEWTGTARWDECIAVCDSIINSTNFSLEPDYFTNFLVANKDSKENIFVVPYTPTVQDVYEGFYSMGLHYQSNRTYNTKTAPSNGFCALPDHYHSFDSTDYRRQGWSVGPQYIQGTTSPTTNIHSPYIHKPVILTPDFIDVYWDKYTFTPPITGPALGGILMYKNTLENCGARLVKYQIENNLPFQNLGVPLALFRYADILMLKAEAIMWKNGGVATQEAVNLVNQIRTRAKGVALYNTTTLTMDELLAERGREFYYEGVRRQDLIRFHKFVGGVWGRNFSGPYQDYWYDRAGESDKVKVFPIPAIQMNANSLLTQNPGY